MYVYMELSEDCTEYLQDSSIVNIDVRAETWLME